LILYAAAPVYSSYLFYDYSFHSWSWFLL